MHEVNITVDQLFINIELKGGGGEGSEGRENRYLGHNYIL